MASHFGISFVPGAPDNGTGRATGRTGALRNPVQEAVKILSLRLPKFYGSQSIAPAPLLTASGGMGQPAARGNVTAQALAQLAGLPPSMAQPRMPAPMLPAPAPPLPSMGGTKTTEGWLGQERQQQPPRAPIQDTWPGGGGPPLPFERPPWPLPPPGQGPWISSKPELPDLPRDVPPDVPAWTPAPPRVTPGQETGEGPSSPVPWPPPPWIDPRPELPDLDRQPRWWESEESEPAPAWERPERNQFFTDKYAWLFGDD